MRWLKTAIVALGAGLLLTPAMSAAQDGMEIGRASCRERV